MFSTKDFFSKCDQIRNKLRIWSHLLKKYLMENFIFLCSVRDYLEYSQTSLIELLRKKLPTIFERKPITDVCLGSKYDFLELEKILKDYRPERPYFSDKGLATNKILLNRKENIIIGRDQSYANINFIFC